CAVRRGPTGTAGNAPMRSDRAAFARRDIACELRAKFEFKKEPSPRRSVERSHPQTRNARQCADPLRGLERPLLFPVVAPTMIDRKEDRRGAYSTRRRAG